MEYGWGKPVEDCTDRSILYQLEYHKKQVREGRVGTPNVYVRIGDLEREAIKRGIKEPPQMEPENQYMLNVAIMRIDEKPLTNDQQVGIKNGLSVTLSRLLDGCLIYDIEELTGGVEQ